MSGTVKTATLQERLQEYAKSTFKNRFMNGWRNPAKDLYKYTGRQGDHKNIAALRDVMDNILTGPSEGDRQKRSLKTDEPFFNMLLELVNEHLAPSEQILPMHFKEINQEGKLVDIKQEGKPVINFLDRLLQATLDLRGLRSEIDVTLGRWNAEIQTLDAKSTTVTAHGLSIQQKIDTAIEALRTNVQLIRKINVPEEDGNADVVVIKRRHDAVTSNTLLDTLNKKVCDLVDSLQKEKARTIESVLGLSELLRGRREGLSAAGMVLSKSNLAHAKNTIDYLDELREQYHHACEHYNGLRVSDDLKSLMESDEAFNASHPLEGQVGSLLSEIERFAVDHRETADYLELGSALAARRDSTVVPPASTDAVAPEPAEAPHVAGATSLPAFDHNLHVIGKLSYLRSQLSSMTDIFSALSDLVSGNESTEGINAFQAQVSDYRERIQALMPAVFSFNPLSAKIIDSKLTHELGIDEFDTALYNRSELEIAKLTEQMAESTMAVKALVEEAEAARVERIRAEGPPPLLSKMPRISSMPVREALTLVNMDDHDAAFEEAAQARREFNAAVDHAVATGDSSKETKETLARRLKLLRELNELANDMSDSDSVASLF